MRFGDLLFLFDFISPDFACRVGAMRALPILIIAFVLTFDFSGSFYLSSIFHNMLCCTLFG